MSFPNNTNLPNSPTSLIVQPTTGLSSGLRAKFAELIAKISQAISRALQRNSDNNLGSPKVQEAVATALAEQFLIRQKEERDNNYSVYKKKYDGTLKKQEKYQVINPTEWRMIAIGLVEDRKDLSKKSPENVNQTLKKMYGLIGNPDFKKKVLDKEVEQTIVEQPEREQTKLQQTNLERQPDRVQTKLERQPDREISETVQTEESKLSVPQTNQRSLRLSPKESQEIVEVSRDIVGSWLKEQRTNSNLSTKSSFEDYAETWRLQILLSGRFPNHIVYNVNQIMKNATEWVGRYNRCLELSKQEEEIRQEFDLYQSALRAFEDPRNLQPKDGGFVTEALQRVKVLRENLHQVNLEWGELVELLGELDD